MKKFYNLEARSSFKNLELSLHNYFFKVIRTGILIGKPAFTL